MSLPVGALLLHLFVCLIQVSTADVNQENIVEKPKFVPPKLPVNPYAAIYFSSPSDLQKLLVVSAAKKDSTDEAIAKYDGIWSVEVPKSSAIDGDFALVLKSKAKHHAVASKLLRPIKFDTNEIVIQYEVKFEDGIDCGGAYMKLLSSSPDLMLNQFNDKTPYTIMFGPDKCGVEHKYHFIIRYKNPKTGEFEEKHAKKVTSNIDSYFSDGKTHLYTLVVRSDNTFTRYIDEVKVQSGSLLEDLEPPINPPKEVDDPNDKRPDDWDERETIVDPNARKPDDWDEEAPEFIIDESATKPAGWLDDEPLMIPDPSAEAPKDWDSEMDGEWEAPKIKNPKCDAAPGCGKWTKPEISNPKYKGKWTAPVISNPAYKGKWKPRKISNPDFYEDKQPFKSLTEVSAFGLELWSMNENIVFDNFLIADSMQDATRFSDETWKIKTKAEKVADPKSRSVVDAVRETVQEKPLVVAAVGLVCSLSLFACCFYMCRSPSPTATAARRKKTDEPTTDDPTSSERDEPEGSGDEDEEEQGDNSTEEDIVDVAAGGDSSNVEKKNTVNAKAEQESDSADEHTTHPPEKQNVRKRRSRKD